jgi:hypothetical protein
MEDTMIKMTDSQLQQDVLNELKWEPGVRHEKIGVSVTDGVVTLSGMVPTYSEKVLPSRPRAASRVCEPSPRSGGSPRHQPKTSDAEIAKRVADVLEWNSLIPHDKINVTVEDRVVRLRALPTGTTRRIWPSRTRRRSRGHPRRQLDRGVAQDLRVVRNKIEDAFERQADPKPTRSR